jgi:hypothetical protein
VIDAIAKCEEAGLCCGQLLHFYLIYYHIKILHIA